MVVDWFWRTLIHQQADVTRVAHDVLRFDVPVGVSLTPLSPLGGIHSGRLEVAAAGGLVTVDVTLSLTRAPGLVGAAAIFAGLIGPFTPLVGGIAIGTGLALWPWVVARRTMRALLHQADLALQEIPGAVAAPLT